MNIKSRIVVFGSKSFVGSNLCKYLKDKNKNTLFFSKKECNFLKKSDVQKVAKKIKFNDKIIFIAAKAPAKNQIDLEKNIKMIENFCLCFSEKKFKKLVYISSDAVYADVKKITENTKIYSKSFHGRMHILREFYLKTFFDEKLLILRPTLVYGIGDPHNGYGPNKFIRLSLKNKDINLFGKGEEKRDHIHINDLTNAIFKLTDNNTLGEYNVASGNIISFYKLAKFIIKNTNSKSRIIFNKRIGPMPHLGYRSFEISKLVKKVKIRPKTIFFSIKRDIKLLKKYHIEY